MTDAMNPYLDTHQDRCILEETAASQRHGPIMFFEMVPAENVTKISCSRDWTSLHIYKNRSDIPITSRMGRGLEKISDSSLFQNRNKRAAAGSEDVGGCGQTTLPLTYTLNKDTGVYSFAFSVGIYFTFVFPGNFGQLMCQFYYLPSLSYSSRRRRRRAFTTCTSTAAPTTSTTRQWH